jgi:GR25 family glycosyltransferase involved in LPS biosynthesis
MNDATPLGLLVRLLYRTSLAARHLRPRSTCRALGSHLPHETIEAVYVINLDRQRDRWRRMCRELRLARDASGRPLSDITRRFSAVDARHLTGLADSHAVHPYYSLGDHLSVDPHPSLVGRANPEAHVIEMTRQEVAVALSHVAVWRLIAAETSPYALILEDDAYFRREFARTLDRAWETLVTDRTGSLQFDVLYLSYLEVHTGALKIPVSASLFRPVSGLWLLSGYVLSTQGARKLLDALPVRGPVDLWINQQFAELDVFATTAPIVTQRPDSSSTNLHSISPLFSQMVAVASR